MAYRVTTLCKAMEIHELIHHVWLLMRLNNQKTGHKNKSNVKSFQKFICVLSVKLLYLRLSVLEFFNIKCTLTFLTFSKYLRGKFVHVEHFMLGPIHYKYKYYKYNCYSLLLKPGRPEILMVPERPVLLLPMNPTFYWAVMAMSPLCRVFWLFV